MPSDQQAARRLLSTWAPLAGVAAMVLYVSVGAITAPLAPKVAWLYLTKQPVVAAPVLVAVLVVVVVATFAGVGGSSQVVFFIK